MLEKETYSSIKNYYIENFIKEFYDNAGSKVINSVRKQFEEFAKTASLPQPKVKCEECGTEYPVEITFDYTRFFVDAS